MFRVEFRNEVLCALGKTVRTNLQILRYFQEKTVWAQFPASFHIYKCTKITNGDIYSSCLAPSLCQNVCLSMLISPHQNHVYWPSPLCWTVPQTCWGPVSCAIVLILLPIKFNLQLSCCAFFFFFFQLTLPTSYVLLNTSLCTQIHSEARQTKILEFGADTHWLQGQARRMMADAKKSELFNGFQAEFSKATSEVRAAGVWFSSDWLVVFHKSCAQS